ncbi:peroxisomal membrane protein PEX16-like isoform X2 [Halichondria panicea]|uniref:peroxisomal membrane protein PEX16-like isoform X2 n=1 Tax=Halichondria panicea TaxID=6063 RepID=UPI00312B6002
MTSRKMDDTDETQIQAQAWPAPLRMLWEALERYQEMVVSDPNLASKLEAAFRVGSYIIPGRFGGSWELSEVAYSVSNLYSLLNDFIVSRRCPSASKISACSKEQQVLLWLLTLLDTLEVAVEMISQRLFQEPGKWAMVILMQTLRAVLRSLLVFKLHYGVIRTPPVPSTDRKQAETAHSSNPEREDAQPLAWKAPRTGRIIRSVHTDPTIPYSELQHNVAPLSPSQTSRDSPSRLMSLDTNSLIAEALYIARPLVHIISMFIFQQSSWKPWLLALGMDLTSLQLHCGLLHSNSAEKAEVMRRRVVLMLYLLRSPFYDKRSKNMLLDFLRWLSSTIPLLHFIVDPLMTYLPVWQQVYSYNWMT